MKYWKQGFYDEPQEGSIEITEGYYQKLLAGQSAGLEILESKKGYPILVEPQYSLEDVIKIKFLKYKYLTNQNVSTLLNYQVEVCG
jgi:hypothetical protein